MNSSENIANAVQVLYKTYENVQKLMDHCRDISSKNGYTAMIPKFLRWKSDNDYDGWLLNDFILLFQKKSDIFCDNQWYDGPVYVMEIKLGDIDDASFKSTIYLSKFTYNDIKSWSPGCSVANHWVFYKPLRSSEGPFETKNNGKYAISKPRDQKTSDYYWGLKYVITQSFELTSINVNNVKEKIFGAFDELRQKAI